MRVEGARRMLFLLLVTVTFISVLSGCSTTGVCEGCGEETKIVKYNTKLYEEEGEDVWLCKDCLKELKEYEELSDKLGELLESSDADEETEKVGECEWCEAEDVKLVKYNTKLRTEEGEDFWVCKQCLRDIKQWEKEYGVNE